MRRFGKLVIPYVIWLAIFVMIPLLAMVILSFANTEGLDFSTFKFSLDSIKSVFSSEYVIAFWNSLKIALISTFICFVIGYPVAYFVSTSRIKHKMALMMVIILPMWSNMLLRIMALEKVFSSNFITNVLKLGSDGTGLNGTMFAVIFGTVMMYLPFMILPIFTTLEKMDKSLIEASHDLGLGKIKTFIKTIFPLSLKGVFSGFIMVFLPSATGFVVTERLGAGKIIMIGNIIEQFFKKTFNYNMGSLLSLVVIIVIMGSLILLSRNDEDGETLL